MTAHKGAAFVVYEGEADDLSILGFASMYAVYVRLTPGGLQLLPAWEPSALVLTAPPGADAVTAASMRLYAAIASSPVGLSRTDLRRRKVASKELFDAAIKNLLDGGVIKVHIVSSATKPKSVYVASSTIPISEAETSHDPRPEQAQERPKERHDHRRGW